MEPPKPNGESVAIAIASSSSFAEGMRQQGQEFLPILRFSGDIPFRMGGCINIRSGFPLPSVMDLRARATPQSTCLKREGKAASDGEAAQRHGLIQTGRHFERRQCDAKTNSPPLKELSILGRRNERFAPMQVCWHCRAAKTAIFTASSKVIS